MAPIADALPQAWQPTYADLAERHGVPEDADFASYSHGGWIGPTSPASIDELRQLSVNELVEFLRNWVDPGQPMSASPEGLSRVLTGLVTEEVARFAREASAFQDLDPTYVRGILGGFTSAARAKATSSGPQVLELAAWVVDQPREIEGRVSEYSDLDPGWVWTRTEIGYLLSAGLERGDSQIPFNLRPDVWKVLEPLTNDPSPPAHEDLNDDGGLDPATQAINTTRGEALHATIRYGLWVLRHKVGDEARPGEQTFDLAPEARDVLEAHLALDRDSSLAIRSVYGQWLPWLFLLDREWTLRHLEKIFPTGEDLSRLWVAAWETYIVFCPPYDDVAAALRSEYMRAAERLPDEGPTRIGSNRPTEHLAEHLVALYWRGRLDSDDPLLREFFERAEAEDRAYAISFAGHAVQHWDREFSSEPLARLVELWESRLRTIRIREGEGATELTSFGWLFTSRAFDPEWSLEQLLEVLTLTSGRIADDVEVVKRLSELAETNPRRAAEAIRLMLRVEGPVWWIHATTDELRQILRTALESDRSAAEIAVDAANDLGARGFIEFRDLRPLFPP